MRCKQILKQTQGEVSEVELEGLRCSRAEICRRKGICALSPWARPELVPLDEENAPAGMDNAAEHACSTSYEVLKFKYSLGFHWVRMENFEEAVRLIDSQAVDEQPRMIRRIEYFKLPE
jgi:hypothetical protein